MQKITPHLWFDTNAEEAAKFYTSAFKDAKLGAATYYTETGKEVHGMEAGTVLTVDFEIKGHKFITLNGGPLFTFTPAISFMVSCDTVEEVDELWNALIEGGRALMPLDKYSFSEKYGWVEDKFGLSWQIMVAEKGTVQNIVPALLFVGEQHGKAEEAVHFYTSVFKGGKAGEFFRYGAGQAPDKEGTVMYVDFELEGQKFAAMDSAREHNYTFNEAVSLMVTCKDQEEIDYYWEKLSADPKSEQCGWLKDKYGVSWQVVPAGMEKMLNDPDHERASRAMNAMLQMKKIDINGLERALEGN